MLVVTLQTRKHNITNNDNNNADDNTNDNNDDIFYLFMTLKVTIQIKAYNI